MNKIKKFRYCISSFVFLLFRYKSFGIINTKRTYTFQAMLSISKKSQYGLKALLALAANYEQGLLSTKDISSVHDIPHQYLEQIFNQLGKANIIRSVRGKQGGYTLARQPGKILASEIITLLEGGVEFIPAGTDTSDVIQDLLRFAENKLLEAFNVSLEELLSRQLKQRDIIMYDI